MCTNNSYILQTLFKAIRELKEHPEAKECIEYVNDFLNNINNEEILKQCSISWDNKNIGFLLVWDVVLPKYLFKADMIICKDYYHYHFIIRDREGKYLGSDGISGEIVNFDGFDWNSGEYGYHKTKPFWTDIVGHLEEVFNK